MSDLASDYAASDPAPAVSNRPRRGWLFAAAIVLILAGLAAMIHPFATSLATALVLGFAMVAGGAFAVAAGIADRGGDRWLYLLLGLAGLAIGIIVLLYPFVAAASLVWTIGAWLVAGGILQLVAGFRRSIRAWLVLFGLVDVALGILLLVMDPISAVFFLAVAVGFTFAFHGASMVALALRLRGGAG